MKRALILLLLLLLLGCANLFAQDWGARYAPLGQLILTPFASAPFPHPLRAEGHKYGTNFFSAAENYHDSQVAIFVPRNFRAGAKVDFVVHFHGWGNTVTNALLKYRLIEQFTASKRNAILIVPQGPYNASDSFDGKLEDAGGFKRFMEEAMTILKQRAVLKNQKIGRIILSGHSGGYEVISSIAALGGLNEHLQEIWLFDALYANTEKFMAWFAYHKGRFVDIYTDHGGTKQNTENLMAMLKENHVPFYAATELAALTKNLEENRLIFLHGASPHDEVMQQNDAFRRFLETSSLDEVRR